MVRFTLLTFVIAYGVSGVLIILGNHGYATSGFPDSLPQVLANVPFAIYILSPAIASYIVLRRSGDVANLRQWLGTVFHVKNGVGLYAYVVGVLALYFLIHLVVSGPTGMAMPFSMFFLSLPGNLIIGGLEEAGWVYVLQSRLQTATGYLASCLLMSVLWLLWHIPLFFIPGTGHSAGVIDFWMFAVQLVAFRFLYGAISTIAGKGYVFLCVLGHTMFNAASSTLGIPPTTWAGTLTANAAVLLIAIATVAIHRTRTASPASAA